MSEDYTGTVVTKASPMKYEEKLKWTRGPTSLSLLPPEKLKPYFGLELSAETLRKIQLDAEDQAAVESMAGIEAPASKDWRNENGFDYVKGIKDQGACASGPCFDICAAIESNIRIKMGDPNLDIDLSEAFLLFCSGGDCMNGVGPFTVGLDYARSTGITPESCFPYQPRDMPCSDRCSDWQNKVIKIKSYASHNSMQARKNAIADIGPVLGMIKVYDDLMKYTGGIYIKSSGSVYSGITGVCVVGYDDADQCWIIKKSWGTSWGEDGFCRIAYGQADLGIDTIFPFYSVDPHLGDEKGHGKAVHILIDKHLDGDTVLWVYSGNTWRHKAINDNDLVYISQELFAANRVDVWWDKNQITMIRPWKTF